MDIAPDTIEVIEDEGPVIGAIRNISKSLHYVAGAVIVVLMTLVVAHVLGRHFFTPPKPVPGIYEIIDLGMVVLIYLGFAYAQFCGDHITVDLLYEKVGKKVRIALDVFAGVVNIVVIGLMVWRLETWTQTLERGNYITQSLKWRISPAAWIAVIGAFFFLLAAICTLILTVRSVRKADS